MQTLQNILLYVPAVFLLLDFIADWTISKRAPKWAGTIAFLMLIAFLIVYSFNLINHWV